jgi:hypothetical protein
LEFDGSKGIPGVGKGIEGELFKIFTMDGRNNKVITISELLR